MQGCKKKFYFDDVTKNNCFLSDPKMLVGRVPDGEFFDNRHMDRLFLFLAVRKKSSNFTCALM